MPSDIAAPCGSRAVMSSKMKKGTKKELCELEVNQIVNIQKI